MNGRKLLSLLLTLALLVTAVPFSGAGILTASAETDGYYTYTISNGEAIITGVDQSISGDLTIPDTLGGCKVTSIGDSASENCNSLTSITIPNSVTSIGNRAFRNCTKLTSITIPDGVKSIGDYAFQFCESLTSITIPDGVTSIGKYAFYSCDSLISITIPDGVTSIGNSTFRYCNKLTSITIPDSVTSIGVGALYGTAYYEELNNWQNGVLYIGNHLIAAKEEISGEYKIKDNTVTIADYAFSDCYSLTSITIPGGVTSIGNNAFASCDSLTSITIPNSVTSIGNYAFDSCDSLTNVTIGDGVTSIGKHAFYYCKSLTSITIPDSVTSIGSDALYGTAYYEELNNWQNGVLYIGNHLIKANKISGEYKIKDNTLTIADFAFDTCSSLTSITIPGGVTSIGSYAFYDCGRLTSITIPDGVTSIGNYAFFNCPRLKNAHYCGNKEKWQKISVGFNNTFLTNVIHYNDKMSNATCTEPSTCTVCGYSEGSALGHNYSKYETTNATCTEAGGDKRICSVCGYEDLISTMPALGHDLSEPTCTEAAKCQRSGCDYTEGEPLGHNYNSVVTEPTCTKKGYTTHTCTRCGESYVDGETEILSHNMADATCTEPTTCTGCGYTEGEPLGHNYNSVVTEPTCTKKGYTTHTCTRCGESYVDGETNILPHDMADATCTEPSTCAGCGYIEGSALGHNYSKYETTNATCTEAGGVKRICSVCGYEDLIPTMPALGHDLSEPTCTEAAKCQRSGCDYTEGEPLGHNYNSVVTEPTCTKKGYTTHTCTRCGESYVDSETEILSHNMADATCTEPSTCTVCGYTEGEALGHNYSKYETINATCTEAGGVKLTCTNCGQVDFIETSPIKNHQFETNSNGISSCKNCELIGLYHPDFVDGKYAEGFGYGDLGNDGIIGLDDLELLNEVVCNVQFDDGSLYCDAADVNKDGKVDLKDVVRIKKLIGIISTTPDGGLDNGGDGGASGDIVIPDPI